MTSASHHIAILGCGVIGLSTALAILGDQSNNGQSSNCLVTIVSKEVPDLDRSAAETSRYSAEYASIWAGGHHVSDAKSERELRHDKITFERMSLLARHKPWLQSATSPPNAGASSVLPVPPAKSTDAHQGAEPLVWVHQTELFERAAGSPTTRPPYEGVLDWYPDFKPLPPSSLKPGLGWGCTFSTLDINVPIYHKWLLQRFLELGGRLVVAEAKSLRHAVQLASSSSSAPIICSGPTKRRAAPKVDVLVASPGLGARRIDGLNDDLVHPQRGQVVVVNAPWLSTDLTNPPWAGKPRYKLPGYSIVRAQGGREVYVIPRGDGTVVCGGTRIVDDWDPNPREETTKRILERCLELVPQLGDPKRGTGLGRVRVEDVQVVGVNVGLRPARRGGPRLGRAKGDMDGVKVVYNYGYGGAGYQASWGAALDAKQLVEEALGQSPTSSADPVRPSKL